MADFSLLGGSSKITGLGANTSNTEGTEFTTSGTINTKGAWTEIVASTLENYQSLFIFLPNDRTNTLGADMLIDVGVGGAGSEEILIPDLFRSQSQQTPNQGSAWEIPVKVAKGERLSVRAQASTATRRSSIIILGRVPNTNAPQGLSKVTSFGVISASSQGTLVDPGATDDTKGAWVEFSSSTPESIKGFALSFGVNGNTAQSAGALWLFDVAVGGSGSEEVILENTSVTSNSIESFGHPQIFYDIPIPSGSRIAIRAQFVTNDSTDRLIDVTLHGVS